MSASPALKLTEPAPQPADSSEPGGNTEAPGEQPRGDAITSWLVVLGRMLRMGERQRRAICDELESHLRERVRDLQLSGTHEADAMGRAIGELGGAVELAARFRAAHQPIRSNFMKVAMLSLVGVVCVAGVVAIAPGAARRIAGGPPPVNIYPGDAGGTRQAAGAGAENGGKLTATFERVGLSDVLLWLGQSGGRTMSINWNALEQVGLARDTPVTMAVKDSDTATVMRLLNEQLDLGGGTTLDWRDTGGMMEIATSEVFDRRERSLASYDLTAVVEEGVDPHELLECVQKLVYPTGWSESGGDMATAHLLGQRMFVRAPARYHERIAWVIEQFVGARSGSPAAAAPGATAGRAVPVLADIPIVNRFFTNAEVNTPAPAAATMPPIPAAAASSAGAAAPSALLPSAPATPLAPAAPTAPTAQPAPPPPTVPPAPAGGSSHVAAPAEAEGLVYLAGQVVRPGVYTLPGGREGTLTVKRLLDAAGGVTGGARLITVSRGSGEATEVVHSLPADEVMRTAGPDPLLKANDRVVVAGG